MEKPGVGSHACTLDIVRTEADLAALVPEWEQLWRGVTQARATQAPQWSLCSWRLLKDNADVELFVICVRMAGNLVGVVPLKLEREAGGNVLKYLGLGYDEFAGVVLRDDVDKRAIMNQVIDEVIRRGDIARISIKNLPDESPLSAALLERKLAFTRWTKPRYFIRWGADDDWDAYLLSTRSKTSLRKYDRLRRKLILETGAALVRESDPAVIAMTVDWIFQNKIAAFEERGVGAFLDEETHKRFLIDVASSEDSDNHIGVYALKSPEKIIAAVIIAHGKGIAEGLIITHDPEYAAFAPGRIAFEQSAADAFSTREEYDFGPGDHQWKRTWRTGEAVYRHVELYLSLRAAAMREPGIFLGRLPGRVKGKITHHARQLRRKFRLASPQ